MTSERDPDSEATVEMPRPFLPFDEELEEVDPEQTLVREDLPRPDPSEEGAAGEDWESTVIRRVASHVVAVCGGAHEGADGEDRFGWESAGLRRLSREVGAGK